MKIFINRRGSGWGGVVGSWLIDTTERKIINLRDYYVWNEEHPHQRHSGKLYVDCLSSKMTDYPADCVKDFNYDLSLLEQFLGDCELRQPVGGCMDHQMDVVYVLTSKNEVRLVWDTRVSNEGLRPENDALCAKLRILMDFIS